MLEHQNGRLLVYASRFASCERRVKLVSTAVKRVAKLLKLNVEIIVFRESTPIYVYYKNGDDEPIPIYFDKNEESNMQGIYATLRNMMFVLSFHPKYSALRRIRKEIMRFS